MKIQTIVLSCLVSTCLLAQAAHAKFVVDGTGHAFDVEDCDANGFTDIHGNHHAMVPRGTCHGIAAPDAASNSVEKSMGAKPAVRALEAKPALKIEK